MLLRILDSDLEVAVFLDIIIIFWFNLDSVVRFKDECLVEITGMSFYLALFLEDADAILLLDAVVSLCFLCLCEEFKDL